MILVVPSCRAVVTISVAACLTASSMFSSSTDSTAEKTASASSRASFGTTSSSATFVFFRASYSI